MKTLISILIVLFSVQLHSQNFASVTNFLPGIGSVDQTSMGFGGEVTARFDSPVENLPGKDVFIEEYSNQSSRKWVEKVRVYFSQDSCNWIFASEITQSDSVNIEGFDKIQYIKLIDSSNPFLTWSGEVIPNGYDLVSIVGNNSTTSELSNTFLAKYPRFVSYNQGLCKNGSIVEASRSNSNKSLFEPENTDQGYNFFSLGMGGWAIYTFEFAIFDEPGFDVTVVETSWGNPSCVRWPESVMIEGSYLFEGPYYFIGETCLDGSFDIQSSGINGFHYIRLTDRTPATLFDGNADGYDVDGLIAINQCPTIQTNSVAKGISNKAEIDYYIIKNFYGNILKEGFGDFKTDGLKPGSYILETTSQGNRGSKMLVIKDN